MELEEIDSIFKKIKGNSNIILNEKILKLYNLNEKLNKKELKYNENINIKELEEKLKCLDISNDKKRLKITSILKLIGKNIIHPNTINNYKNIEIKKFYEELNEYINQRIEKNRNLLKEKIKPFKKKIDMDEDKKKILINEYLELENELFEKEIELFKIESESQIKLFSKISQIKELYQINVQLGLEVEPFDPTTILEKGLNI